jgi:hypothetical protein
MSQEFGVVLFYVALVVTVFMGCCVAVARLFGT